MVFGEGSSVFIGFKVGGSGGRLQVADLGEPPAPFTLILGKKVWIHLHWLPLEKLNVKDSRNFEDILQIISPIFKWT